MLANVTVFKPDGPQPKPDRKTTPLRQASDIQRQLHKDVQDEKTTPAARAQLARAWLELERLKREIRMKPKPKPVDVALVSRAKKSPRQAAAFQEPAEQTSEPTRQEPQNPTETGEEKK